MNLATLRNSLKCPVHDRKEIADISSPLVGSDKTTMPPLTGLSTVTDFDRSDVSERLSTNDKPLNRVSAIQQYLYPDHMSEAQNRLLVESRRESQISSNLGRVESLAATFN